MRPHILAMQFVAALLSTTSLVLVHAQEVELSRGQGANTFDVGVDFYKDNNCMELIGDLTLTITNCYSNVFTNASAAYMVDIVRYHPALDKNGVLKRQAINIHQYKDDCQTSNIQPIQAEVNQCNEFIGSMYGIFRLKQREQGCSGPQCSKLEIVVQEFFLTTTCSGVPDKVYKYPMNRECLRYRNGTQIFYPDQMYINITEVDFRGNSRCDGLPTKYIMKLDKCYDLYGNRAFHWRTERSYLSSGTISLRSTSILASIFATCTAVLFAIFGMF